MIELNINEAVNLKAYKPEGEAKQMLDALNGFDED